LLPVALVAVTSTAVAAVLVEFLSDQRFAELELITRLPWVLAALVQLQPGAVLQVAIPY
jgi:hypothetical protein